MKRIIIRLISTFIFAVSANAAYGSEENMDMKLTSPAFENGSYIPARFTCDGSDINPALVIENVPAGTKTLALVADDPDAPVKTWVHWVVYDIDPTTKTIKENSVPGKQGLNDFRRNNWGGPCPPSGIHRYYFKLYALDNILGIGEGIDKKGLEKAMTGHILAESELVGLYKRGGNH